ncbi:MAG: ACP S-malonyltransferase [Capsulimonadaceae bacterium]|nr:ACP S-malonyltransferase [Capsulimonadaceae bacterium]
MKLAFLFPGQGSQAVGMGADLYANNEQAAAVLNEADAVLGYNLSALCFEGPDDKLRATNITQPALFAVSVAALRAVEAAGITPSATAGHSVGEYAALVAAGVMDFETGVTLVAQRGELMRQAAAAHPGGMAAVLGLPAVDVQAVCAVVTEAGDYVDVANLNGAGQVVISGEQSGVDKAGVALKEKGARKIIPLAVSGAFHSRLMQPAVHTMRGYLELAAFQDAKVPVVANVTAAYETKADEIRENLSLQIASPVRWEETIERLLADGFDAFVEIGSGKVLTNIVRRISKEVLAVNVEDASSLAASIAALGAG